MTRSISSLWDSQSAKSECSTELWLARDQSGEVHDHTKPQREMYPGTNGCRYYARIPQGTAKNTISRDMNAQNCEEMFRGISLPVLFVHHSVGGMSCSFVVECQRDRIILAKEWW
jgi:hypothetical protein